MIDRHLIGDVALAALLAIPAAALARPDSVPHNRSAVASAPAHSSVIALASRSDRPAGLLG